MRVALNVAAIGLLLGFYTPITVVTAQPSLLGRGYSPFLNQVQEVAVTPPPDRPIAGGASNTTQFGFLASNQDFERVIDADMSVSAAIGGWGASLRASLTKEYREDRRRITFAAVQKVIRGSVSLPPSSITLNRVASRLLRSDPSKYMLSYGTSVIEAVELGGSAVFLFTFHFNSEEEAMRSSLNAEGHYGAAKGSLSVSVRELLRRSTNNVTVSGFVTGTTKFPTFFGVAANGSRAEVYSARYSEEMLQSILTYLDDFQATIKSARTEELSQVGFVHRHLSNVGSVRLSAKATEVFNSAESFANDLQDIVDLVDERRTALRRMTTIYKRYNTDANVSLAASIDRTLLSSEKDIEKLREALATYGTIDEKSLAQVQVPPVPPTFCITEPTDVSPPRFRRLDAGNPKNQASSPPRKWLEFIITPRLTSVTYTVWAEVSLGHSRSHPGCNWGHAVLRVRKRGAPPKPEARELGSWSSRPNPQLGPDEDVISDTGEFGVCRRQPDQGFGTRPYSFVASDTHEVRILYSNWDDIGYTSVAVRALRCGQQ